MAEEEFEGGEDLLQEAGQVKREDAERFWDNAASGTSLEEDLGKDFLTYEQAREEGLLDEGGSQ